MNNFFLKCVLLGLFWAYNVKTTVAQPISLQNNIPKIPSDLQFAGETVPLDNPIVYSQLEKELIKNVYKHSSTLIILKRVLRYKEAIRSILTKNQIPQDFFYLAVIESELSPYAESGKASGFWQFRESTARELNLEISKYVDQRRDLELSTQAACTMLKLHNGTFKNWTLSAAAFNAGRSAISNTLKAQSVESFYDIYLIPESYDYVYRILALKIICENPEKYGFTVGKPEYSAPVEEVKVSEDINLIDFSKQHNINYNILKYYNPWLIYNPGMQPSDKYYEENRTMNIMFEVKPGKVYRFLIPK